MNKLIRADLYKSFHRMYLYVFMAAMAGLSIFINVIMMLQKVSVEVSFGLALGFLMIPMFFISMFADIIFAEENKEHTLKNTVSYGVSRSVLYLSKYVSTLLVAVAVAIVTLGAYVGSALLLLHPAKPNFSVFFSDFSIRIGVAILIYIAAASLAVLLAAVIKRNSMFAFAYFGLLIIPVIIFKILSLRIPNFTMLQNAMLFMQIRFVEGAPQAQLMQSVWISLAHIVIFTIVGMFLFKKQEVN